MSTQASARQLIRAAIAAAGGAMRAGADLGVSSQAVSQWASAGRVPADRIKPLCDLGGNAVDPLKILDAMAREASEKAAA